MVHFYIHDNSWIFQVRVATGQGKVREIWFSSRSGKSQGILETGQGNFKYQESQAKIREFHYFCQKYVL